MVLCGGWLGKRPRKESECNEKREPQDLQEARDEQPVVAPRSG
jgi:hypothetical protein